MKKVIAGIVIATMMLTLVTTTVFAGTALQLVAVSNQGAGPTFFFRVTGEFSQSELEGFVQVEGGDSYPLYCAQQTADTVICHATKKVGGKNVVVGFGGARFWTTVPGKAFCYGVWDWTNPQTANSWTMFATHCQDTAANVFDQIFLYNPDWGNSFIYTYYNFDAPNTFCGGDDFTNPNGGYYFTSCP